MGDNLVEQIVQCRPSKSANMIKALMIVLCVVSLIFILIPYIGVFLTAIVIAITVFVFRSYNYEYEYVYLSGELDVDKIIARAKRKRMASFDFNRVELVAPQGSQEDLRLSHNKYRTYDFTSNMPDARIYAAYTMKDNEMVKLLFEPNEKLLKELQYIAPRKVIL